MALGRLLKKWKRCLRIAVVIYIVVTIALLLWSTTGKFDFLIKQNKVRLNTEFIRLSATTITDTDKPEQKHRIEHTAHSGNESDIVKSLFNARKEYCTGSVISYADLFATFRPFLVDFKQKVGRTGGENITEVINQPEKTEYYKLKSGFFQTPCADNIKLTFTSKNHLKAWSEELQKVKLPLKYDYNISGWTIAVMRYEYANLYHTMTDFYNAFLLVNYLNINPDKLTILWVDSHPVGALDTTWSTLFGNVIRAGSLNESVYFENFAWNILGYESMLNKHSLPKVPLLESFRQFFLSRHDVPTTHTRNCDKLKVLFIWRRDYVAHPRNPSGLVSRKIQNENELMSAVQDSLPDHDVVGVQIDKLSMRAQLQTIANTDILIGMHGAGLTHTLFLPKSSGLVEIYPKYWPTANKHFRAMSYWRGLFYELMQNADQKMELPKRYTIVKVQTLVNIVHEMHHKMCGDVHGT